MTGETPIICPRRLLDVSPESGWQDDGLYVVQYDERPRTFALDNIKVRTKKGEIRAEPLGVVRYDREHSKWVWKVHSLAGRAQS